MTKTNLPYSLFPLFPGSAHPGTPCCPICGEEAETFYIDRWGMTVGCSSCISAKHRKNPAPASACREPQARRNKQKGGGRKDEEGFSL